MMREEQPQCEVQQMSTWHSFYFHCPFSTKHAALSNLKCYHADSGFFAIDFSGEVPWKMNGLNMHMVLESSRRRRMKSNG
jgi:hypothetical protein